MDDELKLFDFKDVTMQEAVNKGAAIAMASETENVKLKISVVKDAIDGVSGGLANLQTQLGTLGEQLQTQLAMLNKDVQTRTEIEANESNIFVKIEMTNIKTGQKEMVVKEMPLASDTQAGGIDTVMYNAFVQMQADITEIYNSMQGMPRTAVVAGMAEDPSQSDMTQAFTNAIGEEPNANDRLVNVDFNVEYIYSSEGVWSYLGRSAIGFATSQTDGIVKHSVIAGTVGYYVEGVGQVNGWDELVAAVESNTANIANSVTLTGDQSISGVKTFSQSPVVPYPYVNSQAANKEYVDIWVNSGGTGIPPNDILDSVSPILFPIPFVSWNSSSREFGSHGSGTGKSVSGALAPNGKIYGIPYSSATVLEIDPSSGTSREFGSHGSGASKWHSGVLAPNGKIYGIPFSSATVLEIVNMNNYPNFSMQRLIAMNQQSGANL